MADSHDGHSKHSKQWSTFPHPFRPRSARPGSARNWPGSGRNKAARFENSLGPESSFVLGGPVWKQARFGLLPNHSGPDSIRMSHPPDPIHPDGASFPTAREARATARQATARRLGCAPAASFSSAAFSPVSRRPSPPSPLPVSWCGSPADPVVAASGESLMDLLRK